MQAEGAARRGRVRAGARQARGEAWGLQPEAGQTTQGLGRLRNWAPSRSTGEPWEVLSGEGIRSTLSFIVTPVSRRPGAIWDPAGRKGLRVRVQTITSPSPPPHGDHNLGTPCPQPPGISPTGPAWGQPWCRPQPPGGTGSKDGCHHWAQALPYRTSLNTQTAKYLQGPETVRQL